MRSYKIVLVRLDNDLPGTCYTGFKSKEHCKDWLRINNFDEPPWRYIIFLQEIDVVDTLEY